MFSWISKSPDLIRWAGGVHNTLLCGDPGLGATLRLCFLRQTKAFKHYKASREKLAFFRELSHSPLADYSASEENVYLPSPRVMQGLQLLRCE